ncbi:MAG: transposase [Alphaproteobacteria bacterium]|nr:transposase [Alphaproteobacteria bacterium]
MILKTCWLIEQGFGTLKRKFRLTRARYLGCDKVEAGMTFKAIAKR